MKILLAALNSQYVHSNPAVRYLYTVMADTPDDVHIREFTINNDPSYIYGELVRANCDMVCFSCYIWNIEQVKAIGSDLKKACPSVKIVLGGPEVSHDGHIFAMENPWADYILCGEGEYSFYRLAEVLRQTIPEDQAWMAQVILKQFPDSYTGKTERYISIRRSSPWILMQYLSFILCCPAKKTRSSTTSHPVDVLSGALIACPVSTKG